MPIDELVEGPTPEQSDRVNYQKTTHTDEMGAKVGFGYRREPWFETLNRASANAITRDELLALRFYRAAFDRCERSPTKSCLNVGVGGGLRDPGSSIVSSTPAIVEARRKVRLCESVLGSWLVTVRAVALQDRSFSDIAIERFGGRKQDWIIVDEPVLKDGRPVKVGGKVLTAPVTREKIVPRSGRHRETIRQEFYAGLRLLTKQVRTLVSTPGIEEIWVEPGVRSASIRRGVAAPNGLYRLWGNSDRIDDVLSRLRAKHGDGLDFATPADARTALDEADGGMLLRLSEQELSR
ncbi:hypothetical protein HNO88_000490 [Novosphingobium chloroacetimidivorans]|uniref:Uncharacterized protein n=1 Tax=Novosphingobium chloroacetimidivorans TaxID=1428314 RepID=A0A7W7NU53_9SPHN|nr:hypothetical protein [Novosphingobium chloroacetimidivorans]MBB4857183.1 hypothetical protein [Novosphingobium chloroacetimidivorans]